MQEHAFDLRAGTLVAHDAQPPRVAFPDQRRGWPSPPGAPRCRECTVYVDAVVAAVVAARLHPFSPYR